MNVLQREFLESMLGENGNYFLSIVEYEGLDLGTKVLYLERAITQDANQFLRALGKIYCLHLNPEETIAQSDLLHALKTINDLCFNNEVSYGVYGKKEALEHYFQRLGAETDIVPAEFETTIKEMIQNQIRKLCENKIDEVEQQKNKRLSLEETKESLKIENEFQDLFERDIEIFCERFVREYDALQIMFQTIMTNADAFIENPRDVVLHRELGDQIDAYNQKVEAFLKIIKIILQNDALNTLFDNQIKITREEGAVRITKLLLNQLLQKQEQLSEKWVEIRRAILKKEEDFNVSFYITLTLALMGIAIMASALVLIYIAMFKIFGFVLYGIGTTQFAMGIAGIIAAKSEGNDDFIAKDSFYVSMLVLTGFIAAIGIAEIAISMVILAGIELSFLSGIAAMTIGTVGGASVASGLAGFFTRLSVPRKRADNNQNVEADEEAGNINLAVP